MAKERWASRVGLVLAMAGNAVGLGNFLRFPAQAAQNGGGAFLIPYIVALLVMGLPLMWVEWTMGRFGGKDGHHSCPGILQSMSRNPFWKYFGVFGVWTNLMVAAFYIYVESWCLAYAGYSAINGFKGMDQPAVKSFFENLIGSTPNSIWAISYWGMGVFFICIVINTFILSRGLARGIELVAKIFMPLLIVFATILAIRGLMIQPTDPGVYVDPTTGKPVSPFDGLNFVWNPQFQSLTNPSVWLAAAGQIFFTLSIGLGSIHCYASYLRETDDVALTGATTAWTNEFCEVVLGGTILIPIGVAYLGLDSVQNLGFGMCFTTFPTFLNNWGWFAPVAGFLWFGLLFFAAITSSLAMGQPLMAFLQDEFGLSRARSAFAFCGLLMLLAVPVAIFTQASFFDEFDFWAGSFALVVFAFGETILFAWVFGMDRGWDELMRGAELKVPLFFKFLIKYVTPVFLFIILGSYIFKPTGTVERLDPKTGETVKLDKGWEPYIIAPFVGEPTPDWTWAPDGMIGKLLNRDVVDKQGASPQEIAFNENLRTLRTVDRLVMVGMFLFFCLLVHTAWKRRHAEGRA
ncbi:MAG: sodium-dependent transporter [Gemmataceae bacterium]